MHAMGLVASRVVTKMQTWPEYLRQITGGLTPAEISRRSGIQLSTITRWLAGETKPSPAKLATLAAHFPMKLEEAHAVLASYTTTPRSQIEGQIFQIGNHGYGRKRLLRMFSDLELASEIVRRIEEHDSVERPLPFTPDPAEVIQFPGLNVGGFADDEDLPAVAREAETEPTDEQ